MSDLNIYQKAWLDHEPGRCIERVWERPHYTNFHRCTRRSGYGAEGNYCKQHAKLHQEAVRHE